MTWPRSIWLLVVPKGSSQESVEGRREQSVVSDSTFRNRGGRERGVQDGQKDEQRGRQSGRGGGEAGWVQGGKSGGDKRTLLRRRGANPVFGGGGSLSQRAMVVKIFAQGTFPTKLLFFDGEWVIRLIHLLKRWLQECRHTTVSASQLSLSHKREDIPDLMDPYFAICFVVLNDALA
ncbi:MAG: hypothetical protein J3Q66DRAFT_344692 [Benniella sp.]|nr:MAG: hypothetical protein J3Q66DRAFT_344692 [Benniella sp.]